MKHNKQYGGGGFILLIIILFAVHQKKKVRHLPIYFYNGGQYVEKTFEYRRSDFSLGEDSTLYLYKVVFVCSQDLKEEFFLIYSEIFNKTDCEPESLEIIITRQKAYIQ